MKQVLIRQGQVVVEEMPTPACGPGEVLGTRQTGEMQFHIADLLRDEVLLTSVEQAAVRLQQLAPENITPLIRRWLGEAAQLGEV